EDYTNRGRIITPLKDRFGAEVRTHYPLSLDDELALITQEATVSWDGRDPGAELPEHLIEVIARFTRLVRESPAADGRSGVSAPFAGGGRGGAGGGGGPPAAARRGTPCGAARGPHLRPPRHCQHAARQGRVRGQRGGPRGRDPHPPAAARDRGYVPRPARRRRPDRAAREVQRRRHDHLGRNGFREQAGAPG